MVNVGSVEEPARAVLGSKPERDRPRMDPPNVLWFAGTYAIAVASYALLGALPKSHSSVWIFLAALAFLVVYSAASHGLVRSGWWVASGLAAALAVAMAIATAAAGLIAYFLTRSSFLFSTVVAALLVTAQFLALAGDSSANGDDRATAALVTGALVVVAGVFLDAFGRRREAFWFHALGLLSAAAGLVFFVVEPDGDTARGWIPMLVVGTLLVIVSGPIRRATWAVYGVLGYYASLLHYLIASLNERSWKFAVALLAVGLSIFVFGMLLRRYGKRWAARFVRRPPPGVTPT